MDFMEAVMGYFQSSKGAIGGAGSLTQQFLIVLLRFRTPSYHLTLVVRDWTYAMRIVSGLHGVPESRIRE